MDKQGLLKEVDRKRKELGLAMADVSRRMWKPEYWFCNKLFQGNISALLAVELLREFFDDNEVIDLCEKYGVDKQLAVVNVKKMESLVLNEAISEYDLSNIDQDGIYNLSHDINHRLKRLPNLVKHQVIKDLKRQLRESSIEQY